MEVVGDFTGKQIVAMFFRGTKPINGIWATPDIVVTVGACVMPVGYGVGDHRLFVIGFLTLSLVGTSPPRIVREAARHLNMKIPGCAGKYTEKVDDLRHQVIERVGGA